MGPAIEKTEAFSKVKRLRHEAIFGLKWCMLHAACKSAETWKINFLIHDYVNKFTQKSFNSQEEGWRNK